MVARSSVRSVGVVAVQRSDRGCVTGFVEGACEAAQAGGWVYGAQIGVGEAACVGDHGGATGSVRVAGGGVDGGLHSLITSGRVLGDSDTTPGRPVGVTVADARHHRTPRPRWRPRLRYRRHRWDRFDRRRHRLGARNGRRRRVRMAARRSRQRTRSGARGREESSRGQGPGLAR